jgi:hypothetical protein
MKLFAPVEARFTDSPETACMSDLLAIVGPADADEELLAEIERRRPDRVTVLVEQGRADWAVDESRRGRALRDRLAGLLHAIEQRTGAIVVGLAGSRDQLLGWRFDRVVGGRGRTPVGGRGQIPVGGRAPIPA